MKKRKATPSPAPAGAATSGGRGPTRATTGSGGNKKTKGRAGQQQQQQERKQEEVMKKKRKFGTGLAPPAGLLPTAVSSSSSTSASATNGKRRKKNAAADGAAGMNKNKKKRGEQQEKEKMTTTKQEMPVDGADIGAAYAGWVPRQRRGGAVAVEDVATWTTAREDKASSTTAAAAERLWRAYVAARRPVVLRGSGAQGLLGPEWRAAGEWSLGRLRAQAGACAVKVERRDSSKGRFGEGREVRTTFGEFIAGLERGDDLHYMTTQDIVRDADGRPEIIAPPLTHLRADFPMRPRLMGNLIPANINLWMGNSREGSISGLHHDFHDNLYILLKGRKRFTLFPPSDAGRMYVQGRIVKVHPNGLITYQHGVRSDGADSGVEAAVEAEEEHARAEEELAAAEAAVARGEPGAEERLRAAEEALETAMEAVLAAQVAGEDDDDEDGGVFDGIDDFDDYDDEEDEDDDEKQAARKGKKSKQVKHAEDEETEMVRKKDADGTVLPQNFSKIDMSLPVKEREARWPLMKEASMVECEVRAGEMLFLPAGWFHNVTSFSDNDVGLHMAFNYWFHPPDASTFEKPYQSDFWQREWDARGTDVANPAAPTATLRPVAPQTAASTPSTEQAQQQSKKKRKRRKRRSTNTSSS